MARHFGRINLHRRQDLHVRREITFSLKARGLDIPLLQFCRTHSLLDTTGACRVSEAIRLLLFTALLRGKPNRVALTVDSAVKANKPMMIGAMLKRIQLGFSTSQSQVATGVGRRSDGHRRISQGRLTLDDWLYLSLRAYEPHYRKADGIVDDIRMVSDMMVAGLGDPDLQDIAARYAARIEPLRRAVSAIEANAKDVLLKALGEEVPLERMARVG